MNKRYQKRYRQPVQFWSGFFPRRRTQRPILSVEHHKAMKKQIVMILSRNLRLLTQKRFTSLLSFWVIKNISTLIYQVATSDDSTYSHVVSQKLFLLVHNKLISNAFVQVEFSSYHVMQLLFQQLVDPHRYFDYFKRMSSYIIANLDPDELDTKFLTSGNFWKLLILSGVGLSDLRWHEIFLKLTETLQLEQKALSRRQDRSTFFLQNAISRRIYGLLSEEMCRNISFEYAIGPYRVDIAFPHLKLAIEIDGVKYHHDNQGQVYKDAMKDLLLSAYEQWTVIRIPSYEYHKFRGNWLRQFERYIQYKLRAYPELFARPIDLSQERSYHVPYKMQRTVLFSDKLPTKQKKVRALSEEIADARLMFSR